MFNLIFILHHCFILFCNLNLSGLVKLLFFPHSYFPLMDTDNQDFTPLILSCFIGPLTLIMVQLKVQNAFIFHSHLPPTYSLEDLIYYSLISLSHFQF